MTRVVFEFAKTLGKTGGIAFVVFYSVVDALTILFVAVGEQIEYEPMLHWPLKFIFGYF